MNIAFLGLGRMGRELVVHLLDNGHNVTVWNRTTAAAASLTERGATLAETPAAAVSGAQVVFTALFGPDAVREVVLDGALPFATNVVWVDITTVSPADAAAFAEWAAANGIAYVHSPVVGSIGPARAGALGVLLGGSADAVAVAKPLVSLWADPERLHVYDAPGKAATGKLVANLALAISMQGLVEALRLGHSGGMTTDEVLTTLLDKTTLATIATFKGDVIRNGSFDETQFSANLLNKDARLMIHTSTDPLPALTAAFNSLENARRSGHGEHDFSVIAAVDRE
ncbi:MAG TPA: NAD(P)-dependent oxidoreductase [Microbacteriaceae bacterium]|jgi:3-hydroxyisobutyrate dehydrogenase|nr:NAD(P)-dependent oxidoreductase [Microbacteriaceae bacterium]